MLADKAGQSGVDAPRPVQIRQFVIGLTSKAAVFGIDDQIRIVMSLKKLQNAGRRERGVALIIPLSKKLPQGKAAYVGDGAELVRIDKIVECNQVAVLKFHQIYFEMPKAGCVVAMKSLGRICIHGRVDRAQGMSDMQERSSGVLPEPA